MLCIVWWENITLICDIESPAQKKGTTQAHTLLAVVGVVGAAVSADCLQPFSTTSSHLRLDVSPATSRPRFLGNLLP